MGQNDLTRKVIGAAIEVHKELGPGLLESAYQQCLARELGIQDIEFRLEKELRVEYKGMKLDCGYKMDMVVEDDLIIELKAVKELEPIHEAQLLSYMKLSDTELGLLINFNRRLLKDGIKRMRL